MLFVSMMTRPKKFAVDGSFATFVAGAIVMMTLLVNICRPGIVAAPDAKCVRQGVGHIVVISNETLSVQDTSAKLCDTLTILNEDNPVRLIAFSSYGWHVTYDGVAQQPLAENQGFTIVLNEPGTYTFHDDADAAVAGTFTVTNN